MFARRNGSRLLLALPIILAFAACDDNNDPVGPGDEDPGTLTVAARTGWTYVDLGENASVVQVSDPTSSSAWDIAFFATGVMLNGGAAGPAGVEGVCLCQNDGATDEQILAMTPDSELADFEAVTAANIPADENDWLSDALAPALVDWWSYDFATHTVTPVTDNSWIVRTAGGDEFVKLRIAGMQGASQQGPGEVTLEVATWQGDDYGATRSITLDATAGAVSVDLLTGTVNGDGWDLRLEGYTFHVNGGVSGDGNAAVLNAGTPFADTPGADEAPASVFATDEFGGVFDEHPWYRYDLQGNHQIWPNYNVYLVRSGGDVFKVQLISYYNPSDGADRHITFRYAPLTPTAD